MVDSYYKPLLSTRLGYKSNDELAAALDVDAAKASQFESLRADLAFELKQLSDLALSARSLYFNKEDLRAVSDLYENEESRKREQNNIRDALEIQKDVADSYAALVRSLQ